MGLKSKAKRAEKETVDILKRIKKRDFSGNSGIAIKNSFFNLSTNLVAKIGSLIFTAVIARLLMPEIFGLYSLALSTIVLFAAFSDLGIGTILVRYLAKELVKKNGKPGKYESYLFKLKFMLTIFVSFILLISAYFLANFYYNKPIFLALLAGSLYIISTSLVSFYGSVLQSQNNFKIFFYKEIVYQVLRLIFVPIAILLFISKSQDYLVSTVILSISFAYLLTGIYLYLKKPKFKKEKISFKEKSEIKKFLIPMSATILSGIFFGYVDMIMLGRFVEPEFIGFYQAALALIGSAGTFVAFTAGALFPLFSRLNGKQLNSLFKWSVFYTFILALIGIIFTFFLAPIVITLVYGTAYLNSVLLLRIFALLLILDPLIGIYSGFYISQGKPQLIAKTLVFSLILNIILNYFFITYFLQTNHYYATIGAAIATLFAKGIHLGILVIRGRKR